MISAHVSILFQVINRYGEINSLTGDVSVYDTDITMSMVNDNNDNGKHVDEFPECYVTWIF